MHIRDKYSFPNFSYLGANCKYTSEAQLWGSKKSLFPSISRCACFSKRPSLLHVWPQPLYWLPARHVKRRQIQNVCCDMTNQMDQGAASHNVCVNSPAAAAVFCFPVSVYSE